MQRRVLTVLGTLLASAALAGEPAVTDPSTPSPADQAAGLWVLAALQAPMIDLYPGGTGAVGSDAARMLTALERGESLRSGIGWYDPGQTRYGWGWFADRFDADGDKRITKPELKGEWFARLDRDRDGAVTADDFDWSDRSAWAKQNGVALRLFRAIDRGGNGKLSEEEVRDYFKKLAGDKGHVSPDDLRDALLQAAAVESGKAKGKPKGVSDPQWMRSLFAGDLGSVFDGPRVGQAAPDFTLPTQDGKGKVTLSEHRDKRPVVLIFGSFT